MTDDILSGHRSRLKERFLSTSGQGMPEYEIIELLLFLTRPRSDTKQLAKHLIKIFGNIQNIIYANDLALSEIKGIGPNSVFTFKLIKEIISRVLKNKITDIKVFKSVKEIIDYCTITMGNLDVEIFKILFFNSKNVLLKEVDQQVGTINQTPVYPREVVKKALELGASSIVMVHNHPSGDPTPSENDIFVTKTIKDILVKLNINLIDHIVISKNSYRSMRYLNLI